MQTFEDTLEKLAAKAATMRAQTRKVQAQLRLKMETGDDLHEIDFDQLKIENTQYVEKIEERNKVDPAYKCSISHFLQEVLQLKHSSTDTLQRLNACFVCCFLFLTFVMPVRNSCG